MGCGGSSANGPDYTDDVAAQGQLSDAPAALLVTGHKDRLFDGLYNRAPEPWNGRAMYRNSNGRFLYYYSSAADGGVPGWSFDHRDQSDTPLSTQDWYSGGFLSLEGGPAYPPIGSGLFLTFAEEDDVSDNEEQRKHRVNILELEPAVPPPCLSIADQHDGDANDLYILQPDLWNGRPHYTSSKGWIFYYYAANEGGTCGWSLHSEANPGGVKDLCEGGWVGPHLWKHPPQGNEVGFTDIGRCAVTHLSSIMGGDDAVAASVHTMMLQERQQLLAAFGGATAVAMPMVMQPRQMVQQTMTTTTTAFMPVTATAIPMATPLAA